MAVRLGRFILTLSLIFSGLALLPAPMASATGNTIFTCDYNAGLKARPIDGSGTQSTIGSLSACVELEASGSYIYIGYGAIRRISTNGTGLTTLRTVADQFGLLINGGYIYYGYEYNRKIGRMNLDGTGANDNWLDYSSTTSAPYSGQLVIVGNYLYFGGGNNILGKSIWRVPLTGGTPTAFVTDADAQAGIGGIDSDGTYIYWTDYQVGEMGRAAIDQSSTTDNWVTGLSYPWGMQVADNYIYFNNGSSIGRVLRDGTGLQRTWVSNTSGQGLAIADAGVNSTAIAGDSTPPTLTSSDVFTVAENTTAVGTITASESSTISISGGEDSSSFQITRSSETSAALSFVTAPNFEAPTDIGGNNSYIVVVRAIDSSSNSGYETVTVTVTDVADVATFNSLGLPGGVLRATFRTVITISANVSLPSKVTFLANGKRIAGCIKVSSSGTSPSIVATCSWKPSNRGAIRLTAISYPTNQSFTGASSSATNIVVGTRTGLR
jgi:Domain of unknown function (DUF5050)